MPLHLLGKKSWNVYNHDNVERVRRDEAEAAAKEAADEQRMQEADSERRIRLLRGLPVEDLDEQLDNAPSSYKSSRTYGERDRKRRRLPGEDDTERDIRYAKEAQSREHKDHAVRPHKRVRNVPLHDPSGHINLFPEEKNRHGQAASEGNPEAELEKARKERELEDQYTMRFSNAAGFKQAVDSRPWYHGESVANDADQAVPSVNVWGDEDPRRKQREHMRMLSDDPLAAIEHGVKGVRQAEKDRREWKERQRRDINDMIKYERYEATMRDRNEDVEEFSLDGDGTAHVMKKAKDRSHRKHRHHHRHRDRVKGRSPHRHRVPSEKSRTDPTVIDR